MKGKLLILVFLMLASSCIANKDTNKNKTLYSQKMVESRALRTFLSNKKEQQLATAHWDYVPGLVANSVLKAWLQYPEKQDYYNIVKSYADHCLQGNDTVKVGESNIDDLAAGKIFFILYKEEVKKGNIKDAMRYKNCATYLRNKLKYNHSRINEPKNGAGGFFHKAQYPNQMWLDGLYMGPALYAEWQSSFGKELGEMDNNESWIDIAKQFIIIHQFTYDKNKQLNYHAWSADVKDSNSFWAKQEAPFKGCSPEFWGRGMGWYFAALVDVLELMPKADTNYQVLADIANQVAEGLARHQDKNTGCWFQLLQYNSSIKGDNIGDTIDEKTFNKCDKPNYLESSASSMFTYAYYKGIRLGILDKNKFLSVADNAYKGLLNTFIKQDSDEYISIISSCASAGLGPAKDLSRTGTINYYLCGKDVSITENEGKAIGPFIMASLEYELNN